MIPKKTVADYMERISKKQDTGILKLLRQIILDQQTFEETIKWGIPCYTLDGKNILSIAVFKHFTTIWFYHGVLLDDFAGVLVNAQEGKTKAQRQWRFYSKEDLDKPLVENYIQQAIDLVKKGKFYTDDVKQKIILADELTAALQEDGTLKKAFKTFSLSKQNEFHEYILEAKRASTKSRRLDKIIPMIRSGESMNDKYRK